MGIDLEALSTALNTTVGKTTMTDAQFGETFCQIMASLVSFDYVVAFAYRGNERPIDLYSTFDSAEHIVFVALYQAGPYFLDPFYHAAIEHRQGVLRMRDLAPDRFFSSEYYRNYYVQTGLAEEVGFFVNVDHNITIVLSLMRKKSRGGFPPVEFSKLQAIEPLISAMVGQYWNSFASRFDRQLSCGRDQTRRPDRKADIAAADTAWLGLNLTARETAIVDLVLQGHSSESIGLKLDISTGTVKVHRRNVYRKLGISSQTQLLSLYLKSMQ
ncbi:helix-turn-helix transcriptional regulator [Neorhizobium sp. NCHU2750]|uniref:helix-turn-helix domain-containing protein n=1 Tax=Neorhizobium sp. NCHU2750 TaxID=1825976 RepID=UPI000E70AB96|nr:LuxR family transcriptional regulator [Neorhizobium sp. NCHU2750]